MKECWINVYYWELDGLHAYGSPFGYRFIELIPKHPPPLNGECQRQYATEFHQKQNSYSDYCNDS